MITITITISITIVYEPLEAWNLQIATCRKEQLTTDDLEIYPGLMTVEQMNQVPSGFCFNWNKK